MSTDTDAVEPSGDYRDGRRTDAATASPDWVGIKTSYCGSELTVAQVCAVFSITAEQLYRRRRAEGWPLRSELVTQREAEGRDAKSDVDTSVRPVRNTVVPKTPAALHRWRRDMIGRLYAAMECQLAEIEQQQRAGSPISGAERERQTRQMNVMTRSMEKLADVHEQDHRRRKDSTHKKREKTADAQRDPETWRLEIAKRITRIRETWLAAKASGDD